MLFLTVLIPLLYACLAQASALTFQLKSNEEECFYVLTDKPKSQIGYYFAVQSGGSFDVDYSIVNPDGKEIAADSQQRQGDWVFNADLVGEYQFCFSNKHSSKEDKVIDFEITLENDFKATVPDIKKPGANGISKSVTSIDINLTSILKKLQYYKTRNNRNQATVRSTESRIFYFQIYECLLIVGMAIAQVSVVQYFFKGSRKQQV